MQKNLGDVVHAAAGIDIELDRRHDGRDLVLGKVATEEPRRDPAERLLHDGHELAGLHRLELRHRGVPPRVEDLAYFGGQGLGKISRQEPLRDRRGVRGLKLDPLHRQSRLALLRRVARLSVLRHRHAEAEGHQPNAVAAAAIPLFVHRAAAEIDLGFEHGRLAGRGVEHGEQCQNLRIGIDGPRVDAEGQRLVGLVAVDREANLVRAGRLAIDRFQFPGKDVRIEGDHRLGIEHEEVAARLPTRLGLVSLARRRRRL